MEEDIKFLECNIAKDNMSATLIIKPSEELDKYQPEDVAAFMHEKGVAYGISLTQIDKMLKEKMYHREVVVAKATEPVDGLDGYYDFFFETGQQKHPTIRSDGSVDYQSMHIIHSVQTEEVLAVYHPAMPGTHGMDVKGRELRCRNPKTLPVIKGTGFEAVTEQDGTTTYKATMQGRVEYDNYKLFIRDVYEQRGDLDLLTGRIDFCGDVVVHGNVCAGTMIRAAKSITIEGNVESAVIIAEGDIILKKGMQGGRKARLSSGGNIYAYFLEYTDVVAKGNVEANIILNCNVTAGNSIIVKGKKGYIVGGTYTASSLITTTNIGNQAQVRTNAKVGYSDDQELRNHLLMTKFDSIVKSIDSCKKAIGLLKEGKSNDAAEVREAKIGQLKRRILRDERVLQHIAKELEEIRSSMEICKNARVVAEGIAYAGVNVGIDDKKLLLEHEYTRTQFYRPGVKSEIEARPL